MSKKSRPISKRCAKGTARVKEVFDEMPELHFSVTSNDAEAIETAIMLGVYADFQAIAATRPQGSAYAFEIMHDRLFLMSYHWGHQNPADNGYHGEWYALSAFKARPDGVKLLAKLVKALADSNQMKLDPSVALHKAWNN